MLHCIDILSKLFTPFWRKQPWRDCPKNRCSQNLDKLFMNTNERWVTFFGKLPRWRPLTVMKMNSFAYVLQEFCLDLNEDCIPFFRAPVLKKSSQYLLIIQMLVCVCVCVCLCLCVFIPFHLLASSDCKASLICLRCSDQLSFVESISRGFCQVPSSQILNLSYFTSKDENSSWQLLERKRMRWYILI